MRNLLTFLAFLILLSCSNNVEKKTSNKNDDTSSDTKEPSKKEDNERVKTVPMLKDENKVLLSYVFCDTCYISLKKDTEYGDVTFMGRIAIKNSSGQLIRQVGFDFEFNMEFDQLIGGVYEISSYSPTPRSSNESWKWFHYKGDDGLIIKNWSPGEVKIFEFAGGKSRDRINFKRTPEEVTFRVTALRFMSIDHEIRRGYGEELNLLETWKTKQKELGYR